MRNGLFAAGVLALWSAQLFAQEAPTVKVGRPELGGPVVDMQPADRGGSLRIWGRGEYLLWWVKNTPMPVPLVTTGDPNDGFPLVNSAGALGQPATQILFGGNDQGFGAFSGMRFTFGTWLDCEGLIGIEATGFMLERRPNTFVAGSDALGNPPLYLPAFNIVDQAERAVAVSDPLRGFSGDVFVTTSLQLWGGEVNGIINLGRQRCVDVDFLLGFRYADLSENLHIHNTTNDLLFNNTTVHNDGFNTRNQFYGGQIGARISGQRDRVFLDVTGKLALGSTRQVVSIQGDITQTGPGAFAPGTFLGGLFAQPTNIGRQSDHSFTVIPAVELKVGYQLTERLSAFVGYDFMYWNQVVRPGNQIDRNINQSQSPIFGGGALVGPAAPTPLFNRSDFWAQGISFGVDLRY